MKKLLLLLLIFGGSGRFIYAQDFNISFKNKQGKASAGYDFKTDVVVSATGFSASVFLKISSPTLDIDDKALGVTVVNAPYPKTVSLSFKPFLTDTGVHKIIVTGTNQHLTRSDTLTLTVGKSDQWRTFSNKYGAQNFAILSDSVVYFTTLYTSHFLAKVSNNTISYQSGWDNMPSLSAKWIKSPMFIDKNSHIWTGSSAGVGKYDGSFWSAFPFQSSSGIQRMSMDSTGKVWYYTDFIMAPWHISRLHYIENGVTQTVDSIFKTFSYPDAGVGINGLNVDSEGNLWLIAEANKSNKYSPLSRLIKYNGQTWQFIEFPGYKGDTVTSDMGVSIYEIIFDNAGNLWTYYVDYSTPEKKSGLLKFNGSTWQNFENGYSTAPKNIAIDGNGTVWMQFYSTLVSFDGSEWKGYTSQNSPIPQGEPMSMIIDKHNNVWMSWDYKIIIFNPDNVTGMQMAFNTLTDINEDYIITNNFKTITAPNPTQNSTTIHYSLKTESPVSISIYNSLGIEVFKKDLGFKSAGDNSEIISTSDLPSGQYYYVLKAGAQQSTQPLVIVR